MPSLGKNNANINSALVIQASQNGHVSNTGFGTQALAANSGDNYNTAFGYQSMQANIGGNYNSAFGSQVFSFNTTGNRNNAFGYGALYDNVSGSDNCAFGLQALNTATTTSSCSGFGNYALEWNTGANNSAFGLNAMVGNGVASAGAANCAFGLDALYHYSTGNDNCAFGYQSLYLATTANYNCAFGFNTLGALLTGNNNVALGINAGSNYTGAETANIIIGHDVLGTAGESNVTRIGVGTTGAVARNNQQVGQGWPGIYAAYNSGSQNGALTAVGSYTPPAVAGTYRVTVNVYCTVGTTTSFSVKVNYKDLNTTSHADILPLVSAAAPGVFLTNGLVIAAGTYYGMSLLISVDNSQTPITFSTVGTFTTVTYFLNAEVEQVI